MERINRMMTNICSENLQESKKFYTDLLGFTINFESDWFIHLTSNENKLELGIIDKKNEIVPKEAQNNPQGFYLTFVVDNVDDLYEIAQSKYLKIIEEPKDTAYGQRRLILQDPDGTLVDISSPIPNFNP